MTCLWSCPTSDVPFGVPGCLNPKDDDNLRQGQPLSNTRGRSGSHGSLPRRGLGPRRDQWCTTVGQTGTPIRSLGVARLRRSRCPARPFDTDVPGFAHRCTSRLAAAADESVHHPDRPPVASVHGCGLPSELSPPTSRTTGDRYAFIVTLCRSRLGESDTCGRAAGHGGQPGCCRPFGCSRCPGLRRVHQRAALRQRRRRCR